MLSIFYNDVRGSEYNYLPAVTRVSNTGLTILYSSFLFFKNYSRFVYNTVISKVNATSTTMTLYNVGFAVFTNLLTISPLVGGAGALTLDNLASYFSDVIKSLYTMSFNIDNYLIMLYGPMAMSLGSIMVLIGVMLGVYVPLIPFVLFISGAINWLIASIEAMFAAPLIAFGVTHPEGHQLLGKAEQTVMLLLSVFIRPPAMIIGFLTALILSDVAIKMFTMGLLLFINDTFVEFNMATASTADTNYGLAIVMIITVMIVYSWTMIEITQLAFSLIDTLPREINKWIGTPGVVGGSTQMLDSVKGKSKEMGQSMGSSGSRTAAAAPQAQPSSPGSMGTYSSEDEDEEGGDGQDVSGDDESGGGSEDGGSEDEGSEEGADGEMGAGGDGAGEAPEVVK